VGLPHKKMKNFKTSHKVSRTKTQKTRKINRKIRRTLKKSEETRVESERNENVKRNLPKGKSITNLHLSK
jgi:hypothetical protein